MKKSTKLTSIALALLMLIGVFVAVPFTASASTPNDTSGGYSDTETVLEVDEYGYSISSYYLTGTIQGVDNGLNNVDKSLIFTKDEFGELSLNDVELKEGDCVDIVLYKGNNTFEILWEDIAIREDGKYRFNTNVDASYLVYGTGGSSGTSAVGYGVNSSEKKANPVKISVKTKTIKAKTLKKRAVTVSAITVKNAKGTVSYKKASGSAKVTVNKKNGKLTVKKGTKKGVYKVKVKITAKGNTKYKSVSKTVTVKIKVK